MEDKKFEVDQYMIVGAGIRFAHYIIDLLFIYAFIFMLGLGLGMYALITDNAELSYDLENVDDMTGTILFCFIMIVYYCITEMFLSRSFSKYITGSVVVMADGSKPSKATMLGRTFCRFIPFDALTYLFRSPSRGFHDSITDTYVVNKKTFEIELLAFKNAQGKENLQSIDFTQPNPEVR